jgi:PEP-CTERM motif
MKLFNIAAVLIATAFTMPANATGNKHHTDFGNLLALSSFKFVDLSEHKSEMSHSLFSKRDSQVENDFDHSLIADGQDNHNEHEYTWSEVGEHENEGHHYESQLENEHGWGNGEHWGNNDHRDHDEIGDYCHGGPTQPVPEPESYAMMLAGLLMLGVARRHQV